MPEKETLDTNTSEKESSRSNIAKSETSGDEKVDDKVPANEVFQNGVAKSETTEKKTAEEETPCERSGEKEKFQKSLFMRARRNSFPPLSGHYSFHGVDFWTGGIAYGNGNGSQGTVSAGSSLGTNGPLLAPLSYKGQSIKEQSTQTDSSYIQMLKTQRPRTSSRQNHLEKTIDELVKKGRNQTEPVEKKRKIPSMIQVAQVKRKRKSRIRRRKNTRGLTKSSSGWR